MKDNLDKNTFDIFTGKVGRGRPRVYISQAAKQKSLQTAQKIEVGKVNFRVLPQLRRGCGNQDYLIRNQYFHDFLIALEVLLMQNFPQLSYSDLINLISSSFEFELVDPFLPQFANLGKLRIVGVVINELSEPEVCLLDESDPEKQVDIYPISHLKVDLRLSIAA